MKRKWLGLLLAIWGIAVLITLTACSGKEEDEDHTHSFSMWTVMNTATCTNQGVQTRVCSTCGFTEYLREPAKGHTIVVDAAVRATCIRAGKTEGSHCSNCGLVVVRQTAIAAGGEHTPVVEPAVAPTCTTDGKTEGTRCRLCGTIIVAQTAIPSTGHQFDEGVILRNATCSREGTKKYTCTVGSCGFTYNDSYTLPAFSATEIYNQSIQYVGEITTYDRSGNEYALGTGFVLSADGKIVTNYHVIEGAYSAVIEINGQTHNIASVLAYDSNIDLAVLKINARNLMAANVCKNPVNAGETVYAIGSSRGLTNTYSQGIVTYADRVLNGVSYVQHDASITHGNSGGPLINSYGEVVGINSWGISDSQNLNFAIFADELDNLVYGTPLTFAEFYEQECNVYEKLKNYIVENGTYLSNSRAYAVVLGVSYSSDYVNEYTRMAYYYVDDDEISLDFLIDDGKIWAYFTIDENIDGTYAWSYFDEQDNTMRGTLYASTFDSDTLLGYSYNNISSSSLRSTVRELASVMISNLCSWIDHDFSEIGVTAADLHFYNY